MDELKQKKKTGNGNLKPFTTANAAEMGRRGGLATKKTAEKRKRQKECLKLILELEPNERSKRKLMDMGIPEDMVTNEMFLAASMFQRAISGDVKAACYIRDLTGQQPTTKLDDARTRLMTAQAKALEKNATPSNELSKLDQILRDIDGLAGGNDGAE